ncbi:MAG: chaperonin GroEL [Anaerolineae bacterium]
MAKSQTRRVVFQPATYQGLQRGIHQIVEAVRPTLGPLPRIVALEHSHGRYRLPELLDDGGVIARRILQLPKRDEDMGAMFVRHLLWRLREEVGDGTATAAVLFRSIYEQGVRYIVAGGNAMRLRHYLENGMRVIMDELTGMAVQVAGKKKLAQIAESICYDAPLAKMMGEIFDIIGEYGRLEIRSGRSREIEREYVEGMYWNSGLTSRQMIADRTKLRTEIENAAILISNLKIEDPRQLLFVANKLLRAEIRTLLVIASEFSESATGVLLSTSRDHAKFQAIAVKTPGMAMSDQIGAMEDLAVLTGGRPLVRAAGHTLDGVKLEDLGRARRVWADRTYFGIVGGKGDPRALRQHIAELRAAFKHTDDSEIRKKLRERIGKLMGGSATLWVGGATELEIDARKAQAERTSDALRGAIMEGVLPGGGVSLLACRPALRERLDHGTDLDERAAYRILIKALEIPIRTILTNAGHDASEVMAEIKHAGAGRGFDVRSGQIVDVAEAGIFDVASVQRAAVRSAVAGAALALTVDVLVHHKAPRQALDTA